MLPLNERHSKIRWNYNLIFVFFKEKSRNLDNTFNYNIINKTRENEANLREYIFIGIEVFTISIL
jgi:hypothetical protein